MSEQLQTMSILIAILIGGAVLIAYCILEKRINHRTCPECGFTMSIDVPEEQCPRCDAIVEQNVEE